MNTEHKQGRGRTIGYWVTTALLAVAFGGGGVADLMRVPDVMATLERLGYPPYLATILGVAKLAGVAAILAPRLPRLKEWAYAGICFDLGGAVVSHLAVSDPIQAVMPPFGLLLVAIASYLLRPADRAWRASIGLKAPRALTSEATS